MINDNIGIDDLISALERSWSSDTALGEWRKDVPSLNQCAVTALIVQDYFGGELLRCKTKYGDSHYWNRLSPENIVDLTYEQFQEIDDEPLYDSTIVRTREYVLSFEDTKRRYDLLCKRIINLIGLPE
jgi:hypothetical protein